MQGTIVPHFMFVGQAEEAMQFWASVVPKTRIESVERWGPEGPGEEGTIYRARMVLGGQPVQVNDSPDVHDFTFTPSISLWLVCDDEAEIGELAAHLGKDGGGQELMPLGNYGFSRQFAWVVDRFGVSWQLILP